MTVVSHSTAGAQGGDLTALIPQLRAFARSLCHDRAQADDLAQDALASAWRHRDAYAPDTNLKAWVFRILRNQFYSDQGAPGGSRSWIRIMPPRRSSRYRTRRPCSNWTMCVGLCWSCPMSSEKP